jgi:hypothetical protein
MAKVFVTLLINHGKEINTKDNLKMTNLMAKVFTTMLMEINTKDNLKMTK